MKFLLIDDDENYCKIVETAFRQNGLDLAIALNGKDGLDKSKSGKPDLILLDEVLPDIPGNEVLKTLKMDKETQLIPVVILSNFTESKLINEAMENGAIDYIAKYNTNPQQVIEKINKLFDLINKKPIS